MRWGSEFYHGIGWLFCNFYKNRKPSLLVVLTLFCGGCSRGLVGFSSQLVKTAPRNNTETGIIVHHASPEDMVQILSKNKQIKYRSLNPQHGQYEVYNLSLTELQKQLPEAFISANVFIPTEQEPSQTEPTNSNPSSSEEDISDCRIDHVRPLAKISSPSLEDRKMAPIQLFEKLHFTGENSENLSFPEKPLKMLWVVEQPEGSLKEELNIPGKDLDLIVTAMGYYQLTLVVQDQNQVCHSISTEFNVTGNKKYLGYDANLEQQNFDLSPMKYLSEINAEKAWTLSTGKNITIAIVDSGVNYNSPYLRNNIKINSNEIPDNNIDDDGNGFTDDVVGWDFVNIDASPFDDDGHGSHVAGLAASSVFGVAKSAKILSIKALSVFGGDAGSLSASILYAVDQKAQIINLSLGSEGMIHPAISNALKYAEEKGVLVVVASGNGNRSGIGYDIDKSPVYPASLTNDNIVAVAAKSNQGVLALYSNFGAKSVDVVAPGGDSSDEILSAFLDNPANINLKGGYGTSMATPIVSGVAALVWSKHPEFNFQQVKEVLLNAGTENPDLRGVVLSSRYIDAFAAAEK
ncbi:MAG: S8 family serine peptidase [Bdellovibrionales bacterium]|nr:S8 family serine peptidase [Bdellovibrionales bacterium]